MNPDLREPWILKESPRAFTILNRDRDVVVEIQRATNAEPDILFQERMLALILSQAPMMYREASAGSDRLLQVANDLKNQGASAELAGAVAYIAGRLKASVYVEDRLPETQRNGGGQ